MQCRMTDEYPGELRILFVGLAESSHTHSWIGLLDGERINVRLFAMPTNGLPPPDWKVRTYLSFLQSPPGLDSRYRCCLLPPLQKTQSRLHQLVRRLSRNLWRGAEVQSPVQSPEEWLSEIIQDWKPHVIHTLGLDHSQGGFFYHSVRKEKNLSGIGKWVLQLRGGSDLVFSRHDPIMRPKLQEALRDSDRILTDNHANIRYIQEMGIEPKKIPALVPVPGTGGLDIESLSALARWPPSTRRRVILAPKACDTPWAKVMPVLEALRLAWTRIRPCEIVFAVTAPEVRWWCNAEAEEFRNSCKFLDRIERSEFLNLLAQSRVVLIPSLVDGVPNILYEAMACGVLPIVSPLETITPVVKDGQNVLFARNLYPDEIAGALHRAMADDDFVDRVARVNLDLVKEIADRRKIRERVIQFYRSMGPGA